MWPDAKGLKLLRGRLCAGGIVATVEMCGDRKAGSSSGGADETEDLRIAIERLAGPVFRDLREEAVLDGIPFGSAGWVVGNGEGQPEGICQLRLEFGFPGTATTAIAAAGVAQDEDLSGTWIAERSLLPPPMSDRVSGKGGCVMRDANHDGASIGEEIIDAVRYGDAGGVRAEIVIVDQARGQIPAHSGILEIADQFALLGIHADDGVAPTLESVPKIAEIEELIIAIRTMVGREFFVIDPKGIAHPMEKTGDGVGADDDTEVAQRHGNLLRSSSRPLQPCDGIAGGVVFEQELDQCDNVGGFFSTGLRPPPERRVRPEATF